MNFCRIILSVFLYTLVTLYSVESRAKTHLSDTQTIQLNESYGVKIPNVQVNLDNGKYDIAIELKWGFKSPAAETDYIDSNLIIKDVKAFLLNYPRKQDYWEVINHKLGLFLINKYPTLSYIQVKLRIPASSIDPYPHVSVVKAIRK